MSGSGQCLVRCRFRMFLMPIAIRIVFFVIAVFAATVMMVVIAITIAAGKHRRLLGYVWLVDALPCSSARFVGRWC